MADDTTKRRVEEALTKAYFHDPGDFVDVSDGLDDNIHVVVVSRKLAGRRLAEKNDLLWSILTDQLQPTEWGKVTLSIGTSPEDIKAASL